VATGSGDPLDRLRQDRAASRDETTKEKQAVERRADRFVDRHRWAAPFLDLLGRVIREQSAEQVGLAASGAAFWLVISVFPAAIAAVSVFGLVVSPQRVAQDLASLARHGPQSLGSTLAQQLQRVAAADRIGLSAGLAVSLPIALWGASKGVYNLDRAVRAAYGLPPDHWIRARVRALVGALLVVLGLGTTALLSAAISVVLNHLPAAVVAVIGVPLLIIVVSAVTATVYRFSVDRPIGLRQLLPGAITAAVGVVLVVVGFAVYLRVSTGYTAVYGALAGTIIGMIGTYLATFAVLVGAVINVQLQPREHTD
jgi:membrane protein